MNPTAYIQSVIESFPVLRRKLGPEYLAGLQHQEFDSKDFAARFHGASTSESFAAVFVLSVWGREDETLLGRFSFVQAFSTWDVESRAAFLEWAITPRWP